MSAVFLDTKIMLVRHGFILFMAPENKLGILDVHSFELLVDPRFSVLPSADVLRVYMNITNTLNYVVAS